MQPAGCCQQQSKMKGSAIAMWAAMLLAVEACTSGHDLMPTSGGRPYEVLVVGADSQAVAVVADGLRTLTMEGLPQPEKVFDVSAIVAGGLNQLTRYARSIVMVTTGIDTLRHPTVSYQLNAYARPQLILHLRAADVGQLQRYNIYNVRAMERQLVLHELNATIASLRERHSEVAKAMIDSLFGVRMWVPQDLTKWKCARDFLWLSNDAVQGVQNVCVYRIPGSTLTKEQALHKRDSVMRANVPGETAGSYMTTVVNSVTARMLTAEGAADKPQQLELRGLWAMEGEAMGGPFVSLSSVRGDSTLVVEAFVYAPGMRKRNQLRRLEASIHTLAFNAAQNANETIEQHN